MWESPAAKKMPWMPNMHLESMPDAPIAWFPRHFRDRGCDFGPGAIVSGKGAERSEQG